MIPDLPIEITQAFSLHGKVVVVTGAGSGIGREVARLLAVAGGQLILADIDRAGLVVTADIITSAGGRAQINPLDSTQHASVEDFASTVLAQWHRLDVWVNCAGISRLHSILDTSEKDARDMINVNLLGYYWGTMAAGRVMRQCGGGSIVNISSGGATKALPTLAIYGMTKAAVNSLTLTSAVEFGPFGIRVNAVSPGLIDTPGSSKLYTNSNGKIDDRMRELLVKATIRQSPLGKMGVATDIAFAVLYLASDAAQFITGQILPVNGGEAL